MSQITARINLSAKTFPFVSANWGQTVLVPQYDTNFNRQVQSTEDLDHDVGIPQVYYMHNVMPHAQGFQSIGYKQVIDAPVAPNNTFSYQRELRDNVGNYAKLGICTDGSWYVWEDGFGWLKKRTSAHPLAQVYVAYVSGISYIWSQGEGGFIYDWTAKTFSTFTITALTNVNVVGITQSYGYLLVWTSAIPPSIINGTVNAGDLFITNTFVGPTTGSVDLVGATVSNANLPAGTIITGVTGSVISISQPATGTSAGTAFNVGARPGGIFWSSTLDPTDFTPSLITGAGGGEVEGAQGTIVVCVPHTKGIIVYTENNAVAGIFSNNARFPFVFQPIIGSGGVSDPSLVTFDADSSAHYAYTTTGLQLVGLNTASTVVPEVTDFVSGKIFEDFDTSTNTFSLSVLSSTMKKHVQLVASRYLVISYGIAALTHALVIDLVTQRIGKLRIDHVDCFEIAPEVSRVTEVARECISFLQSNGVVKVVDFNEYSALSNGCLILGKYQFVRARLLVLDGITIENIPVQSNFSLEVMTSLEGKSVSFITSPYLASRNDTQHKYLSRLEGTNHSLLLKGGFHLESGILIFSLGGKR
jgi:hypothetical protein